MTRNFSIALLSFILLAFVGCASQPKKPLFIEASNQLLSPPPSDKAQITFLEPINSIQGLIPVGIYEVNEDESHTLLAITGSRSKSSVVLNPGHHRLMANQSGMIAHYLEANVEAGKHYYVLVRFIYGQGFQLRPLRTSGTSDYSVLSKDFPSWVSSTRFVEKTKEGEEFFQKIDNAVTKSQVKGWNVWLKKTKEERAELTLGPKDAVTQ